MRDNTISAGAGFRLLSALYHDRPMLSIWSEEATVASWLRVEAELARAQADVGLMEAEAAETIAAACRIELIDLESLWKSARIVGYPILPLVRQVTMSLPEGPDGRVHYGATTQDIMDSALAIQLWASCDRLTELTLAFGDALAELTRKHARTVMAARTHAQHAVPTTFGAKMAVYLAEMTRHLEVIERTRADVRVVSLFGAGGTSAALGDAAPAVRTALARRLDLSDVTIPWHVSRDRVARFGQACTLLAATCVRFAREVIDLSRTEIGEVHEERGHHRGASSTMPQKANPIMSESVVGYGVAVAGSAGLLIRAMEAQHERSAGEWQIEWLAVPQVAEYTAAALALAADVAATLEVSPERMQLNLDLDGHLLMSEAYMIHLAPVLGRERAHDVVYAAAMESRKTGGDLWSLCVGHLPSDVLAAVGQPTGSPIDYVGQAPTVSEEALSSWVEQSNSTKEICNPC